MIDDVLVGARFLARLPGFLRSPLPVAEAEATLARRLENRSRDFRALVRHAVYGHAGSPYRALLSLAGCEMGDVERLVEKEGVEDALRVLYRHGVYLTVDELKGKRPAVRGGTAIATGPEHLRNPARTGHVVAQTSGSRGARTPVALDLDFLGELAVDRALAMAARGARSWRLAYWDVPGGGLGAILVHAKAGTPPVRWFSPVPPDLPGLHARYRWSSRVARWGSLLAGRALPVPHHVPVDAPLPIARWMAEILEQGQTPFLTTYSSPAVRLCQAAHRAGIRLDGAQLALYGEPITEPRLAAIRRVGAEATPVYVTIESGRVGEGCLAPVAPDDIHLFHDFHAVIQPGVDGARPGLPAEALLLTSLRATAPVILLNASMGDQAFMASRRCDCPLERVGWTTHLHTIRSYEKLTAAGMTFLDADVIRVLDEVLPAHFGGAPTDYQLLEDPADDGHPRLRLLVHPALGALDPDTVTGAFMDALGAGSGTERIMGTVWRNADLLRVERRPPLTTASGKILHLHLLSSEAEGDA
jgi:hypothetical protein